jgi:C-3',4' desaturase CrtD
MTTGRETPPARIVVIGAGVAGLTTAALLAQAGHDVTVLEAQAYPGGSAGTFFHKGYRFEAGATVAGGFQTNGPHAVVGEQLGIAWDVRVHEPAWVVHMPEHAVGFTADNADVLRQFPRSRFWWDEQSALADLGWSLSAQGLPWPPTSLAELRDLAWVGVKNAPRDLRLAPFALMSTHRWMALRGLAHDRAFVRLIDGQLLISAQTTSRGAVAVYSATALDLARQGVYHARGGIGRISEQLADKLIAYGGRVLYKHRAVRIRVRDGRAVGVEAAHHRKPVLFEADFVVANLTPWNLDTLLAEHSPASLRREVAGRAKGWGAFVLHLGLRADRLPAGLPDHHQFLDSYDQPLGEGHSLFLSLSPTWDDSRAPAGMRAATITTHTDVLAWAETYAQGEAAYEARKAEYTERMLRGVERYLPGFGSAIALQMSGSPHTYAYYTGRHLGQVGGFPQRSLFQARSPLTGVRNIRLVGDSIFPGQSTAGVSLGAMRVATDVLRHLPRPARRTFIPPAPAQPRAAKRPRTMVPQAARQPEGEGV